MFFHLGAEMKRGCPDHPKTEMLKDLLGVRRVEVIGHLEMLFHFTGKFAPHGNIGRWPDRVVASRCGWEGDPAVFIQALIDAGWVDEHPVQRLVVHDWSEHADESVHKTLRNKGETFADGSSPFSRTRRRGQDQATPIRETVANDSRNIATDSRQPEPEPEPFQSQSQSQRPADRKRPTGADLAEWPEALAAAQEHHAVDGAILRQIIAAARGVAPDVTDAELAECLHGAWKRKQESAALWVHTVPPYLAAMRKRRKPPAPPPPPKCSKCGDRGMIPLNGRAIGETPAEIRAAIESGKGEYCGCPRGRSVHEMVEALAAC